MCRNQHRLCPRIKRSDQRSPDKRGMNTSRSVQLSFCMDDSEGFRFVVADRICRVLSFWGFTFGSHSS